MVAADAANAGVQLRDSGTAQGNTLISSPSFVCILHELEKHPLEAFLHNSSILLVIMAEGQRQLGSWDRPRSGKGGSGSRVRGG